MKCMGEFQCRNVQKTLLESTKKERPKDRSNDKTAKLSAALHCRDDMKIMDQLRTSSLKAHGWHEEQCGCDSRDKCFIRPHFYGLLRALRHRLGLAHAAFRAAARFAFCRIKIRLSRKIRFICLRTAIAFTTLINFSNSAFRRLYMFRDCPNRQIASACLTQRRLDWQQHC